VIRIMIILGPCLLSCRHEPLEAIPQEDVHWKDYRNPAMGLALSYPDPYEIQRESGEFVFFLHGDRTAARLNFVTEREGRSRGLWFGNASTGDIQMAGRVGQRYDYTHWDGPFGDLTIAFVVPYRDRYLGLEFRSAVGPIEEAMVRSLKLDDDERTH